MRQVPSAGNLSAEVEGDIEEADETIKITKIRLRYHISIPAGARDKVERALQNYAERCPAYQSVKGCIDCSWDAEITER